LIQFEFGPEFSDCSGSCCTWIRAVVQTDLYRLLNIIYSFMPTVSYVEFILLTIQGYRRPTVFRIACSSPSAATAY